MQGNSDWEGSEDALLILEDFSQSSTTTTEYFQCPMVSGFAERNHRSLAQI